MNKYTVKAYLENDRGLMESLDTDDFSKVEDFIWEQCHKGLNCHLTNNETGVSDTRYVDDFDEYSTDIGWTADEVDELLADLALEQREQM